MVGIFPELAGNVGGAAVAFLISRKLGRGWVEKRFFQHRKWAALDAAIARDGWKIIFLSQVHPLFPSSLLNYLYGITRIRFGTCMLWIALGQAPGLFLYAYLGTLTQLGIRLLRGQTHPQPIEYVIWIGGLRRHRRRHDRPRPHRPAASWPKSRPPASPRRSAIRRSPSTRSRQTWPFDP